jgi:hypothetical protein
MLVIGLRVKNIYTYILVPLLVIVAIGVVPSTALSDGKSASITSKGNIKYQTTTPYSNSFSAANSLTGWTLVEGSWGIENCMLRGESTQTTRAIIILNRKITGKYSVSVDVYGISGSIEPQVIVGFSDINNYHFAGVGVYSHKGGIGVFTATGATALATGGNPNYQDLASNVWYNIRVDDDQSTITLLINGTEVCTATGATHSMGKLGLTVYSGSAYFDNFEIRELSPSSSSSPADTWTLVVAATPENGGSTSVSGTQTISVGQSITVSANPSQGNYFVNWVLDGVSTTSNPITIPSQLSGSTHNLIATFNANQPPPQSLPILTGTSIVVQDGVLDDYPLSSFAEMKNNKLNHVVINFGWNKLEKTKGTYDSTYLSKLDTVVQRATDSGLYVIIRSHKWIFLADTNEPIGYQAWDPNYKECIGFPAWIPVFGFWDNANGCHQAYINMMQMLANRYKNNPKVIGFSLISEPGNDLNNYWENSIRDKVLHVMFEPTRLWKRTIDAIHLANPNAIVIFEGHSGRWFTYSNGVMVEKPDCPNIYAGQSMYSDEDDLANNYASVTNNWHITYVLTEIGVEPEYLSQGSLDWLDRTLNYCKQYNIGWSHWNWGGIATSVKTIVTKYGIG